MTRGGKYATEEERQAALRENRRRYDATEKGKANYARYRQTEKYAAAQERAKAKGQKTTNARAHRLRVIAEEPEKYRAWLAVAAEVKAGRVVKPDTCQSCARAVRLDAHHHRGYAAAYRLDVVWLCRRCHKAAHQQGVLAA